eukprot:scaffold3648_cov149-Amphora_coffeaeformis.AAC.6
MRDEDELNAAFQESYQATQQDWHACVQAMVGRVMEKPYGATPDAIMAAARHMPYLTGVRSALDTIHQCNTKEGSGDTGQMILSDGNTLFIGAFLDANGLAGHFTHGVISNEGRWVHSKGGRDEKEVERLEVVHQSKRYGGHFCDRCPKNLCKTQALQHFLDQHFPRIIGNGDDGDETGDRRNGPSRIVYVGDGANDACPALHVLGASDVLMARAGRKRRNANSRAGPETDKEAITEETEGGAFGILPALRSAQEKGETKQSPTKCQVLEWTTGDELKELVAKLIEDIPVKVNARGDKTYACR